MQVVACQLDIVWQDKAANFVKVADLLSKVEIRPGALVVLPEMFATGFSLDVPSTAEEAGGPTFEFLAHLAMRLSSTVVAGVVARDAAGKGLNQAVVIGPDGQSVASYGKLHPFSYGGEARFFAAGSEVVVVPHQEFVLAPFVCYDLRFPEVFRHAVLRGAQLLVVIANWPKARDGHWTTLLKARAIENQAYVVGVNRTGRDPHLEYIGNSRIIDPRGQIVAEAGQPEQSIVADVQLDALLQYREEFPALKDVRPEFLGNPR